MALHSCFQPAFPQLPTPLPYKPGAASRIGNRRVTHRPGDSVEELSGGTGGSVEELSGGTESVRGDLTTELHLLWWLVYNYSNRIQSLARRPQPGQPSPPTSRNAPRWRWCSSTLDGSSRMDPQSWAGWPTSWYPWTAGSSQLTSVDVPGEVRGYISICERCTMVPCFRKKEGIWCLVWSFGNALCLYVNGLP